MRGIAILLVSAALWTAAGAGSASANSKYAAFVMDADSGEVLYARNGDLARYPASLTKMMTLYLTFDALEKGKLKLTDALTASSHAAAQAPSKLGIAAGQTITVDEAIRALVVRSANDVAVVLAEALGDSESQFAKLMTQRARDLGMKSTTFRNASGLPHSAQRSSAHDLAVLGRRLMEDFPERVHYFDDPSFSWDGRTWQSHNHLLELYPGTDGLKTGYTQASGFNVVTSVHRNGAHLIGVVMGGRTAQSRDREMMRVLDVTFARLEKEPRRKAAPASMRIAGDFAPRPKPKGLSEASALVASLVRDTPLGEIASATPDKSAADRLAAANPPEQVDDGIATLILASAIAPRPEAAGADIVPREHPARAPGREEAFAPEPKPREADVAMAAIDAADNETGQGGPEFATPIHERAQMDALVEETADTDEDAAEEAAANEPKLAFAAIDAEEGEGDGGPWVPALPQDAAGLGGWGVQIGAFANVTTADTSLRTAATLVPQLTMSLSGVMPYSQDGHTLYRARFGPVSHEAAIAACTQLTSVGVSCYTVQEASWDALIRR
ncbi:MAG: SPOR domain-containing protein [Alphaproteobacteria bacterium]|nr:SPOR domain-containing protein [Alphaproteobacteria bacterium]